MSGVLAEHQDMKSFKFYINGVVAGDVSVSDTSFQFGASANLFTKDMNSIVLELTNTDGKVQTYSYLVKGANASAYAYSIPSKTLTDYVTTESNKSLIVGVSQTNRFNDVKKYMDPANYVYHDTYKYMFMDLTYKAGDLSVTAESLNAILVGKGVLEGKGESFLLAAEKYEVNPFYLIAHSLLETGNGKSVLAQGQNLDGLYEKLGNLSSTFTPFTEEEKAKTVYNVFGIGAYDGNANLWGGQKAYQEGWFSVEDAIDGGAKWISTFYVNRANNKQNTLYKMRFNYGENMSHQYATDIGWAYKQTSRIKAQFNAMGTDVAVRFDIPLFEN